MKNLLLAIAFIGFIVSSGFATNKTVVKVTTITKVCKDGDGDTKCAKKGCKHNTKECVAYKKECTANSKKACCANKTGATKSCCAKKATCNKSKEVKKETTNEDSK